VEVGGRRGTETTMVGRGREKARQPSKGRGMRITGKSNGSKVGGRRGQNGGERNKHRGGADTVREEVHGGAPARNTEPAGKASQKRPTAAAAAGASRKPEKAKAESRLRKRTNGRPRKDSGESPRQAWEPKGSGELERAAKRPAGI